ncbi:DoxX family protein [Sulfurovum sp.]|uniref:DoxX family protein n=1 Tax=Sulfurovum sp. TaxID=1969726 RepID=UPI0025ECC972|nr:DoxX family protein [Sulfurovum sp.]
MIKDLMAEIRVLFSYPRNIVLLLARLAIAYGFSLPALMKIENIDSTAKWFRSISIPFPDFTAYLVTGIETLGIVLLVLGLFTRYISLLLGFIMIGAILFVHGSNGYSITANGMEIPIYYLLFLMIFVSYGPGKFSLDSLFFKDGIYE